MSNIFEVSCYKINIERVNNFYSLQLPVLTVKAEVMVGEEGRLAAVSLHCHQHTASVCLHADLLYRGVVSAQGAHAGELQLDVTQLNVVHAVAGHPAAINKQISLISLIIGQTFTYVIAS